MRESGFEQRLDAFSEVEDSFCFFWFEELVEFTRGWNFSFLSLSFFFVWLPVVIYLVVRVFAGFLLAILRESGNWWNEVSPLGFHIIRIFPPFRSRGINYSKSFYYFPPFDLCNWGIVCRDLLLLKFLLFFPSFLSYLTLHVGLRPSSYHPLNRFLYRNVVRLRCFQFARTFFLSLPMI